MELTSMNRVEEPTKQLKAQIQGMSCASCVKKIENRFSLLPGVKGVAIHLLLKTGVFEYYANSELTSSKIIQNLEALGFPSIILSEEILFSGEKTDSDSGGVASLHLQQGKSAGDSNGSLKVINEHIASMEDVTSSVLSTSQKSIRVGYKPDQIGARELLKEIKLKFPSLEHSPTASSDFEDSSSLDEEKEFKKAFYFSVGPAIIIALIMLLIPKSSLPFLNITTIPGISLRVLIAWILATPIQFYFGVKFHQRAWKALRNKFADMNLLISMATNIAYFYSIGIMIYSFVVAVTLASTSTNMPDATTDVAVYFETSAILITVLLLGRYIEMHARSQTITRVRHLTALQPGQAILLCPPLSVSPGTSTLDPSVHTSSSSSSHSPEAALARDPPDALLPRAAQPVDDGPGERGVDEGGDHRLSAFPPTPSCCKARNAEGGEGPATTRAVRNERSPSLSLGGEVRGREGDVRNLDGYSETEIAYELLQVGDYIKVVPGGLIPADGIKRNLGLIHADESLLTGESIPVEKSYNDFVIGGSTCLVGGLVFRVTKVGSKSTLGQIISLISDTGAKKMAVQHFADKVASYFVPLVILSATFCWILWTILLSTQIVDLPDSDISREIVFVLQFGIAVMAIACPCALGLATPTAIVVATGVAAKFGILIKGVGPIEEAAKLKAIVLDKTGTLTYGTPVVASAVYFPESFEALKSVLDRLSLPFSSSCSQEDPHLQEDGQRPFEDAKKISKEGQRASPALENIPLSYGIEMEEKTSLPERQTFTREDIHCLASRLLLFSSEELTFFRTLFLYFFATAERPSEHPLGQAIFTFVNSLKMFQPAFPSDLKIIPGKGLQCTIQGLEITIGSLVSALERCAPPSSTTSLPPASPITLISEWADKQQQKGETVVILLANNICLGAIALKDKIRPEAIDVVDWLKQRTKVYLCSGDNIRTVTAIAKDVGIPAENVVGQALPTQKVAVVKELQADGNRVCMVGDGLNDSPALAQADLGIAIGAGAHITISAADVILVKSSLFDLLAFMKLARETLSVIHQNFVWASIFNLIGIPIAAGALYPVGFVLPPAVSGAIMALSSILVVLSSLRLKLFKSIRTKISK